MDKYKKWWYHDKLYDSRYTSFDNIEKKFKFEITFYIKRLTFWYTDKLSSKTYFWCKQILKSILYDYIV